MRNAFLAMGLVVAIAAGLAAAKKDAPSQKKILRPEGAQNNLPFSPGIVAGDLVFVAGQGDRDPKTGQQPANYDDLVRTVTENVRSVLKAGGMDLVNAVSCHAYFDDLNKRPQMNTTYNAQFNQSPPVRTAVGVAALVDHTQLEITCIAARDASAKTAVYRNGTPPAKGGRGSPGIRVGDLVFLSGSGVPAARQNAPMEDQAKETLESLSTVLKGANAGLKDVVWAEIYTDDPKNFAPIDKVWDSYFSADPKPARTKQVVSLAGAHIEITLVAAVPTARRRAIKNGGVLVGKTLFLSPQSAAGATLEDQVNGAIGKMKASLAAAGMKLTDVVSTQVSLKDVGDFSRMNAVYRKHFAKDPPARTTIQLTPSDPSSKSMVEISCIAVK
jgi:2-iminobutanoate/2-iminopropanoate deaminase